MPCKKLSEYRAKTILYDALDQPYEGVSVDTTADKWEKHLPDLDASARFVAKVDEGVKGRFKKGLVFLDRAPDELEDDIAGFRQKGFHYALIEPYQAHPADREYYLSMERTRDGNRVSYSKLGGVDVESNAHAMQHAILNADNAAQIASDLDVPVEALNKLSAAFDDNFMSFLEINPLVPGQGALNLLDAAVEVDDETVPLVHERWTPADFRDAESRTPEEETILELASHSLASFRLKVLNEDGAVFLLLSGGGASIVVADAVASAGRGADLANYGEYSGNPNLEETYIYTKALLSLMIRSKAPRKVLIIGGGVANFTDIRTTFKGVVRALEETSAELRKQQIKVYVRRGGPHEAEGLAAMRVFLEEKGLLGQVSGPELVLTDIVPAAIESLEEVQ